MGKDDSAAVRSFLGNAARFPQLFHVRVSCLTRGAQIYAEHGYKEESLRLFQAVLGKDGIEATVYPRLIKHLKRVHRDLFADSSAQVVNPFKEHPFALTPDLRKFVIQTLEKHGIEPTEALWKEIRPCIEFNPNGNISRVGDTRLGGLPDVAPYWEWPGKLEFLAQFNMEDLAPHDVSGLLPQRGLLQIFGDGESYERGKFHIEFYAGDLALLHPAPPPANFSVFDANAKYYDPPMVYHSVPVDPHNVISLPSDYDYYPDEERDEDVAEALEILSRELGWCVGWRHRMFGHHSFIDSNAAIDIWEEQTGLSHYDLNEAERKATQPLLDEWVLLFQMDSCNAVGTQFCDAGIYYFMIRKEDLAVLRFDKVYSSMWSS